MKYDITNCPSSLREEQKEEARQRYNDWRADRVADLARQCGDEAEAVRLFLEEEARIEERAS